MTGTGTIHNPWDLVTALQSSRVWPGDTLLLRGGTYPIGAVLPSISGRAGLPITIKSYPGEWAKIDGGLTVGGSDITFQDLEIFSSSTLRSTETPGSAPPDIIATRSNGFVFTGPRCKVINCVLHDNYNGIAAFESTALDLEIYGNILFHTGWDAPDRGHGHEIYAQNSDVSHPKIIKDNIIFSAFADNLVSIYGENNPTLGFTLEGNICFGGGQVIFGGDENIVADKNYLFDLMANFSQEGNVSTVQNVTITNNVFTSRTNDQHAWSMVRWKDVSVSGNAIVVHGTVQNNPSVLNYFANAEECAGEWDNNAYYHHNPSSPITGDAFYTFAEWQAAHGFDANSTLTTGLPANAVFVRPNTYKPSRAHIAIYNWTGGNSVNVDLSTVTGLAVGDDYRLIAVQDYFNDIVTGTVPENQIISVDMQAANHAVAKPIGWSGSWWNNTFPLFGAFIVEKV